MKKTLLLATLSVSAILIGGCTRQIPPASVGIKFNANTGISTKLVKPQVLWVGPRDRLIIYPTSIQNASFVMNSRDRNHQGDDSIHASTSEGAILPVDVTVAYHVQAEDVVKAFNAFGTEDLQSIQRIFVRWTTIYGINAISGGHSIFDLTSKDRAMFGPEVKKIITPILAESGITVDDVYIGEVHPSEEVRKKVEERIATRNQLELSKVELQRSQIDAQTTLTNAKKTAELNRLLALQGEKALELKKLELKRMAIQKWDGKPQMIGDPTVPFTDIQVK
jgi:regulator of protease activity HflC (stomatin/prohibitin superfamily)